MKIINKHIKNILNKYYADKCVEMIKIMSMGYWYEITYEERDEGITVYANYNNPQKQLVNPKFLIRINFNESYGIFLDLYNKKGCYNYVKKNIEEM